MDNSEKAGIKDFPDMILSAQMIIEKFGGQEGIMQALYTNPKTGIEGSDHDIQDRKRIYGVNKFPQSPLKSIIELILENFDDRINQILLVAALVSLVIGLYKEGFPKGLIEGTSIAIALVIICSVTSVNNYYSEKRLHDLYALSKK
jgi:Ca2+-transporting ATPase